MRSLNWVNFFVADMGTSFGPFVTVALTQAGWSPGWIGSAIGAGQFAALAGQLPAGALIDASHHKRGLAGGAVVCIALAALLLAWMPSHPAVFAALITQNLAGVILGPTIAALTLSLSKSNMLGDRLGRNVRFQAFGSAGAAVVLGALGARFGPRAVFVTAACLALPALIALRGVRPEALAAAPARTDHPAAMPKSHRPPMAGLHSVFANRGLLAFGLCVVLFFIGNTGILTLAALDFTRMDPRLADALATAMVIVPQGVAAFLSPRLGRLAQRWGRKAVLLLGFSAVPLRATLFAIGGPPPLLVLYQALDGLGAAAFGVMLPLVVADLSRRGGRFNLSYAAIGLAVAGGAALSNTLTGQLAARAGVPAAFAALAFAGLLAVAAVAFVMPETRPDPEPRPVLAGLSPTKVS